MGEVIKFRSKAELDWKETKESISEGIGMIRDNFGDGSPEFEKLMTWKSGLIYQAIRDFNDTLPFQFEINYTGPNKVSVYAEFASKEYQKQIDAYTQQLVKHFATEVVAVMYRLCSPVKLEGDSG